MSEISFQKIQLNLPDKGFKIEMFQKEVFIGVLIINYFQSPLLYEIKILSDYRNQGLGAKLLEIGCQEVSQMGLKFCYFVNNNEGFWTKIKQNHNSKINGVRLIQINTDQ